MQKILLSGGSGIRLWPLSNYVRSKQLLRVLDVDGSDEVEQMVQRVHRQLRESNINAELTVATSTSLVDSVISQLGDSAKLWPSRVAVTRFQLSRWHVNTSQRKNIVLMMRLWW